MCIRDSGVPVRCVHSRSDQTVPFEQSSRYVQAARAAGDDARLIEVPGDHFALIDPESPDWAKIVDLVAGTSRHLTERRADQRRGRMLHSDLVVVPVRRTPLSDCAALTAATVLVP